MKELLITLLIVFTINPKSIGQGSVLPECKYIVVVEKAYFYNSDNTLSTGEMTKRNAYLTLGDVLWTICKYADVDYVYTIFKNKKGQTTKGFIKKEQLKEVELMESN